MTRAITYTIFTIVLWASGADNDMAKAAAAVRTEMLIILGADDRVVTPGPPEQFAEAIRRFIN